MFMLMVVVVVVIVMIMEMGMSTPVMIRMVLLVTYKSNNFPMTVTSMVVVMMIIICRRSLVAERAGTRT
jgi:hypothetical protein